MPLTVAVLIIALVWSNLVQNPVARNIRDPKGTLVCVLTLEEPPDRTGARPLTVHILRPQGTKSLAQGGSLPNLDIVLVHRPSASKTVLRLKPISATDSQLVSKNRPGTTPFVKAVFSLVGVGAPFEIVAEAKAKDAKGARTTCSIMAADLDALR